MNDKHENNDNSDESAIAEGIGELKASIKGFHADYGIDISSSYYNKGESKLLSKLTIFATVEYPEQFKDNDTCITIHGSENELSKIISNSLNGLPKRLQKHLYKPDYKYFGIIHWSAGASRENPPDDYSTLFVKLDTDMKTLKYLSKSLFQNSENKGFKNFVNIRAVGLDSTEFEKHKQLSVAVTGITISVEHDF